MSKNLFGMAPRLPGVKTCLSSPLVARAILLMLSLGVAIGVLTALPGCNAGVHAGTVPNDKGNAKPADTTVKPVGGSEVTVKTVLNSDGSKTITTTTTTCNGKDGCKRDVKVEQVPPPTPPPAPAPAPALTPTTPPKAEVEIKQATPSLFVDEELTKLPTPAEVEPDYQVGINESEAANVRHVTLSQEDSRIVVLGDFSNLSRSGTFNKAKDLSSTLINLDLPLPTKAEYKVRVKVDNGAAMVEASTTTHPAEKPEDVRARLKRFIASSGGIWTQAAKKAEQVNAVWPANYDTSGPRTA